MFGQGGNNKQNIIDSKVEKLNSQAAGQQFSSSLDANIAVMEALFKDNEIMKLRRFENSSNQALRFALYYSDGVVDSNIINEHIIKPLALSKEIHPGENLIDDLMTEFVLVDSLDKTNDIQKIIEAITYGDTLLLADGSADALVLNSKSFSTRGISEPEGEKILSGPREGFTEALMGNLSLVRRKLRTNDLKMKFYPLGERTKTQACICYLDSLINHRILKELYTRLDGMKIDGVLDTNYITECIRDSSYSAFRATGYTERPDVVAAKLLEGRIAIFLDGTPVVLTIPYLFIENFQSNEDYYLSFYYTSFSRMLRMLAFFITITIPAFYISVVTFHPEMLPPWLLINIASERVSLPLPDALEAFIMLAVFDLLRETGIRMPTSVGQALSIVGALVIGQSAVQAKLVGAPMIIVVAVTGITSLLIPRMEAPVLVIRYMLLFLASFFGFFGLIVGLAAVLIHMLNLHSFGIPQLIPTGKLGFQEIKDTFIRAPWPEMLTRPSALSEDHVRMKSDKG